MLGEREHLTFFSQAEKTFSYRILYSPKGQGLLTLSHYPDPLSSPITGLEVLLQSLCKTHGNPPNLLVALFQMSGTQYFFSLIFGLKIVSGLWEKCHLTFFVIQQYNSSSTSNSNITKKRKMRMKKAIISTESQE